MFARIALRGSNRPLLIAMGAFATAALSLSLFEFKSAPEPAKQAPLPPAIVVVAAHAIARGAVVSQQDIAVKQLEGAAPADTIASTSLALGHVAARDFRKGEVLDRNALTDAASAGISVRVPQGMRAFSIRVVEEDIVGGFLQSGDHVDVFATIPGTVFPAKDSSDVPDRSETVLLLQNLAVLAVGESLATRGSVQSSARTVSVALTPEQLAKLALAQRFGKLSLAIRNPADATQIADERATLADIAPERVTSERSEMPLTPSRPAVHPPGIPFYAGARKTFVPWSRSP